MTKLIQLLASLAIEVGLGVVILTLMGFSWFVFYFFVVTIISIARATDYIRKLVRLTHFAELVQITAIARKLKISDEEMLIVFEEEKRKMGGKEWHQMENEFNELSGLKARGGSEGRS
jgi:hypothetical protein